MTVVHFPAMPGRVSEDERRRIADLDHTDALDAMKDRCNGLEWTIIGCCFEPGATLNGLLQIALDITKAMEQLAADFEAERKHRIAEEPQ